MKKFDEAMCGEDWYNGEAFLLGAAAGGLGHGAGRLFSRIGGAIRDTRWANMTMGQRKSAIRRLGDFSNREIN